MKKKLLITVLVLPSLFGAFKVTERVTFDRAGWTADFQQLKRETERNYANLKWAAPSKKVDFVALNEKTLAALDAARSPGQARAALAGFMKGFDDGHFHFESGPPKPIAAIMSLWPKRAGGTRVDFAMSASDVCSAFGFARRESFEGQVVAAGDKKVGVIRIPLFQHRNYADGCERAWEIHRDGRTGVCDETCQDELLHRAKLEIAADLARAARELQRNAPDGIVIDLTGNGGGTEWAEYAAFALTDVALKPARVASVRGAAPCDLSRIWTERDYAPSCWNVVMKEDNSAEEYAADLRQKRPYTGPLYIMIDEHTASASEQFIALLKDAGVATLIGTRTMGVGCGYTDGGIDIRLKNSGLKVWMPDCARLRADGSNEYDGIAADIPVEWQDGVEKTQVLRDALR